MTDTAAPESPDESTSHEERSIPSILQEIQSGTLDPRALTVNERRICVDHLKSEGYSLPETCAILKHARSTIARDRAVNRESRAFHLTQHTASEHIGAMLYEADLCMTRIRRAVRGKDVSAADRISGERECWAIMVTQLKLMQSMGLLPLAMQHLHAEVSHHLEAETTESKTRAMIEQLRAIGRRALNPNHPLQGDIQSIVDAVDSLNPPTKVSQAPTHPTFSTSSAPSTTPTPPSSTMSPSPATPPTST